MKIVRYLAASLFIFSLAVTARAQNTIAVSAANIQGVNGTKLASGSLCFQGTDQNNNIIAFQVGGGGAIVTNAFCTSVTNGAITTFNVPNPANTTPVNIRYHITVVQGSRTVLWRGVDAGVIDGIVNGVGGRAKGIGSILRLMQGGNVRAYAAWVVFGCVLVLLAIGIGGGVR